VVTRFPPRTQRRLPVRTRTRPEGGVDSSPLELKSSSGMATATRRPIHWASQEPEGAPRGDQRLAIAERSRTLERPKLSSPRPNDPPCHTVSKSTLPSWV